MTNAAKHAGHDRKLHDAYPVRTVARLTGLSADLIRVWEKRYGVVTPVRGPRGARLYSADDVAHLRALAQLVGRGRAIGDVAALSRREMDALVHAPDVTRQPPATPALAEGADTVIARVLAAIERFDAAAVERHLGDALIGLGSSAFTRRVVAPLLVEVGRRWSDGRLTVADEHLCSVALRNLLASVIRTRPMAPATSVLLATPSGERHEFGLLLVALTLLDGGLRVHYLGVDLPAADIAGAARRSGAGVVGRGMVDSHNRSHAVAEIRAVESALPANAELWLGGRDAAGVHRRLSRTRARVLDRLELVEAEVARLLAQPM